MDLYNAESIVNTENTNDGETKQQKTPWEETKKTYFRDYYRKKYVGKTMVCECGKHIALGSYKKHLKSKYHNRVMAQK